MVSCGKAASRTTAGVCYRRFPATVRPSTAGAIPAPALRMSGSLSFAPQTVRGRVFRPPGTVVATGTRRFPLDRGSGVVFPGTAVMWGRRRKVLNHRDHRDHREGFMAAPPVPRRIFTSSVFSVVSVVKLSYRRPKRHGFPLDMGSIVGFGGRPLPGGKKTGGYWAR